MTTEALFRDDASLLGCDARVLTVDAHGIVLDRTVFYPLGGGQAGDSGALRGPAGQVLAIADTRRHPTIAGAIAHVPAPGADLGWVAPSTLVRSMSVMPPRGHGRVRLVEVDRVDLQPCGGTHVDNTADIGPVVVTKVEKKSARTRRVVLGFADGADGSRTEPQSTAWAPSA